MKETTVINPERRSFLKNVCAAAVASSLCSIKLEAHAPFNPLLADAPATHNMLVVGEKAVYLSHLPMFNRLDRTKTSYLTPHRYQVLLEATFSRRGKELQNIYMEDRANNPTVNMYTLEPTADFVLPRLGSSNPLRSFRATIFRGHLERGGEEIKGLEDVTVNVKRVLHFRQFDPKVSKPARLEYLLFGQPSELFLAHFISKPPDFDQIASVKIDGRTFTDAELSAGVRIAIPGRPDSAQQRLRENQQAAGEALIGGAKPQTPSKLQVTALREFYFEEGELLIPATFDPTAEEQSSGFGS